MAKSSPLEKSLDTRTPGDTPAMAVMREIRRKLMSESAEFGLQAGRYKLVETREVTSIVEHLGEIRFHPTMADHPEKDLTDMLRQVLTNAIRRGWGN